MSAVEHFVKGMRPPLLGTGHGFGSGHCAGRRAGRGVSSYYLSIIKDDWVMYYHSTYNPTCMCESHATLASSCTREVDTTDHQLRK